MSIWSSSVVLVVASMSMMLGCGAAPDEAGDAEALDDASAGVAAATGTVFGTGAAGLNVRKTASVTAAVVGHVGEGAKIAIDCQVSGDPVSGNSVWNFSTARGGYLSDAFVWTGHDGFIPGVPKCSGGGGGGGGGGGALKVRGVTLSASQDKWVRHVAKSVVPEMTGARSDRIQKAAYVTWWSLKEGVLGLSNPLAYSNCHMPPDTKIGPLETCPNPNNAWQVGISGVQAAWRTLSDVEKLALKVHPDKSLTTVLSDAATAAGYGGTTTGSSIASSTGRLRLSWLLRDGAVGYEAQYPTVKSECFQTCQAGWESTCAWCFGTAWSETASFAPDRWSGQKSVDDLVGILDGLAP